MWHIQFSSTPILCFSHSAPSRRPLTKKYPLSAFWCTTPVSDPHPWERVSYFYSANLTGQTMNSLCTRNNIDISSSARYGTSAPGGGSDTGFVHQNADKGYFFVRGRRLGAEWLKTQNRGTWKCYVPHIKKGVLFGEVYVQSPWF